MVTHSELLGIDRHGLGKLKTRGNVIDLRYQPQILSHVKVGIGQAVPVSPSGEVHFDGRRIDGLLPYDVIRLGLVHIPEGRRLFPYLNVLQNLLLGASLRKDRDGIRQDMGWVFERFPILRERRSQKAGSLSGGEQMMLAIGRGLMAKPRLLLMDEPSLGLAPLMVTQLASVIRTIDEAGVGVLLVEQNVYLAMKVA